MSKTSEHVYLDDLNLSLRITNSFTEKKSAPCRLEEDDCVHSGDRRFGYVATLPLGTFIAK